MPLLRTLLFGSLAPSKLVSRTTQRTWLCCRSLMIAATAATGVATEAERMAKLAPQLWEREEMSVLSSRLECR